MSTPIETAAEAVIAADLLDRYVPSDAEDIAWDATKITLRSLVQHRDDIAREFERHELDVRTFRDGDYRDTFCYACWTAFPRGADSSKHQTDAVLALLTGEPA